MAMKTMVDRFAMLMAITVFASCVVASAAPMSVKVKNITGKVESQSGGAWKTVAEGDSLPVGASLRTGPASSCIIVWAGGNTAKLGALTNIKVSAAEKDASGKEKTTLDLSGGKLVAHAKKLPTKDSTFKVGTPTAVAGVRGTDEMIEVNDQKESTFGVAEGSVEIESGGETVVVEEGFMVDVDSVGAIAEPEAIPPEMMEEVKEDLKEVNAEAKQAEAEAGGSSSAAPASEEKKENAAGGGDEKKEESASSDSSDESAGGEDEADLDAATDSVDGALDTAQDASVAETAQVAGEEAMKSGDLEIIIDVAGSSAP